MAEVRKISSAVIRTDGKGFGKKEDEKNKEEEEEDGEEDGEEDVGHEQDENEAEPEQQHLELWYRYDEVWIGKLHA